MDIQKLLKTTDLALKTIFEQPEEVLRILGPDQALQVIKKLSVSPEIEAELKECKLMKLIESGAKYVTGQICVEDAEAEGEAENE